MKTLLLYVLFFLSAILTDTLAQTGNIRGFVYDKGNGEPIIFTNVWLQGTTIGTSTDVNGYFSLANISIGKYTLITTYIGYDTVRIAISISANTIIAKKIYLQQKEIQLDAIDINAERQKAKTDVKISMSKITPKVIKQIPSVGGEPDLAQYLQLLPGVIFTGEQGGQLYIRGGSPIQNKVLLDGMPIYNAFHSIGLFSVFETDIIRNVDVYTGGFNAEYGGRLSAIVDITTRDGNKKRLAGRISSNPFMSKVVFEGPIKKLKEDGGSSSFIITSKYSYLDKSSKLLYSYIDTNGLPYNFTDTYYKLSLNADNGSKLNLFGFNFRDNTNYLGISNLNWKANGIGTNYIFVPASSTVLIDGNFSYSDYSISLIEADSLDRSSKIAGFDVGLNFTYFLNASEFKYGIEILGFKTTFDFYNSFGIKIEQIQNTTELGVYIKYKKIFGKLIIEPSFRLHYYASLASVSPEPRLGLKYNISNKLRIKAAGGLYSQNLIGVTSDKDIITLFTGFLSGPDMELTNTKGNIAKNNIQTAIHAIVGTEYDIGKYFDLNIEGYYKDFTQLINLNRNKLLLTDPDYMLETGNAYGGDILLKYDYRKWYLWIAYSLGFINRSDDSLTYPPHFDRRHNVNLMAAYTFGEKRNWIASIRWSLGSGFPFTQIQGYYELLDFSGGINTNYTTTNGQLGVIYGDLNAGRLPYYHRLDISLKKTFAISNNSKLEANVSITNVYDRDNIFYFDPIRKTRVNQLPLLPSIGLTWSF